MVTLDKFGVPGTDIGTGRGGILQPKLKYRFRVISVAFGPIDSQLNLTQQVMNVTKPQLTYDEVQIDSYNSRAWVAGKHVWNPITLVVRDDITNSVSSLVGHQMQKQVNHFEQTAATSGQNYKFTLFLQTLDGGNVAIQEEWVLEGCWLQDVNYDTLDYTASEVQQITMSVRFDNATQSDGLFPGEGDSLSNNSLSVGISGPGEFATA